MEGDEIIQRQVSKFQRISCNGSSVISDTSSNPNKIATNKRNHLFPVGNGGDGIGRLCGWPSSRIVRVSRASGGKDRHSKVLTSKGLRDRRIRLSVSTAIEFYDLQDRLGYDQPSKAVEWLIKAASSSIDELPSLDPSFPGGGCGSGSNNHNHHQEQQLRADNTDFEDLTQQYPQQQQNNNSNSNTNSNNNNNGCSSASDTSKGSGLSLSRSENRIRARERARDLVAKKEKVKESSGVGSIGSFTDLLTGGINMNNNNDSNPHMDYFQMPQFNNIPTQSNQHQQHEHYFHFAPGVTSGASGLAWGLNRGTLQSNLVSSLPHHQRSFQPSSMVDGSVSVSTTANFPFVMAPTMSTGGPDHFQASGYESQRLQLYGGGSHSDHYKEKSKN